MILYKETEDGSLAYIKCECGTHGIEISRPFELDGSKSPEIYLSLVLDSFYAQQTSFFSRFCDKCKKIWYIIRGKKYIIENDIVLKTQDIEELISILKRIEKEGKDNESK